jgi:hypothetical protein
VTGGLGAAALITGGVFAVRTRSAQSQFDDAGCGDPTKQLDLAVFDQCTSLRDRGQREALLANALIASGGAVLAASVIVFILDPGNVERPRATIAATPTSVGLFVRW